MVLYWNQKTDHQFKVKLTLRRDFSYETFKLSFESRINVDIVKYEAVRVTN